MPQAFRALRKQADNYGDDMSELTSLNCAANNDRTGDRDMARQEFKDEADVTKILARFGVGTPQRQTIYEEVDYTLDLQNALEAARAAETAWRRMPNNFREKFNSPTAMINAVATGKLVIDLSPKEDKGETPENPQ